MVQEKLSNCSDTFLNVAGAQHNAGTWFFGDEDQK